MSDGLLVALGLLIGATLSIVSYLARSDGYRRGYEDGRRDGGAP